MGIQKVLVAGIPKIVSQLYKEFLILVCLAAAISVPVVWTFGNDWLENFADSAPLKPVSSGMVIKIALSIILVMVLFQAFRAIGFNSFKTSISE